jgi:hypothetical protein
MRACLGHLSSNLEKPLLAVFPESFSHGQNHFPRTSLLPLKRPVRPKGNTSIIHRSSEGFRKTLRILWNMVFTSSETPVRARRSRCNPDPGGVDCRANHSVYRLGHSTVLLKLRDKFWITDPVFAERASPVHGPVEALTSRRSASTSCHRLKR